eukprot:SAG11_NODE_41050_length_198_cov_83.828283_1_plen_24_part_10
MYAGDFALIVSVRSSVFFFGVGGT